MENTTKSKASWSDVQAIKSKIAAADAEADPLSVIALYEELIPMLREPRKRVKDLSTLERFERREKRRELKRQGINPRTMKPYTPEELAKRAAQWTPERKAKLSAAAKGRTASPETKQKLADAAAQRRAKLIAQEQELAELRAKVAAMMNGGVVKNDAEDEADEAPVQFGKRNRKS